MKILITYYSRTNVTEKIAKKLQNDLDCDIERIDDLGKHSGVIGYLKGGFESSTNRECKIATPKKDPSDYDLVIVGTPVWASNMASPILAYLKDYKDKIKSLACFATCGGSGGEKTITKIGKISGKRPKASFYLTSKEIDNSSAKIKEFENRIKR